MFNQSIKRIGFACKIQQAQGEPAKGLNTKTTTIAHLNTLSKDAAYEKLYNIAKANTVAIYEQLKWIAKQPPHLKMFRISSDLLPAYTYDSYAYAYADSAMQTLLEKEFAKLGDFARSNDIKLSFHPGQFCVLASDRPDVVDNSIYEFEYHCDIIRYMGYGREFQDFKCNVHIGGKTGPQGIISALKKLSPEARNTLTIENAEFTWGLDASLELEKHCALVLDIHHHWIMSGEYIEPRDARFQRVIDSWRGVRPTIHYSVSREEHVPTHSTTTRPNLAELKASGLTSAKLRAHSDMYWNTACNQWAGTFLEYADIMCESKEKNIASFAFAKQVI